jgi:hypothetical protein
MAHALVEHTTVAIAQIGTNDYERQFFGARWD